MRFTFCLIIFLFNSVAFAQELPDWAKQRFKADTSLFKISNYLSPTFLEADFDGDGNTDVAVAVKNILRENKRGVAFYLRNGLWFFAGAANGFGHAGDDFSWADEWKIFNKKKTYQTTFKSNGDIKGTEKVELENPAISIRAEEGSGGLIYFNGEKFVWIHQGG